MHNLKAISNVRKETNGWLWVERIVGSGWAGNVSEPGTKPQSIIVDSVVAGGNKTAGGYPVRFGYFCVLCQTALG